MSLGTAETKPASPGARIRIGDVLPGALAVGFAAAAATLLLHPGLLALVQAWSTPEYSHGPLIPIISGYLFLRQMKDVAPHPGPTPDRWPGVLVMTLALALGLAGAISRIHDLSAYAIILWVAGLILTSFGWRRGRQFWPPVLHLVFMLPLPGVIHYKVTASLQFLSSEIGVAFIRGMDIPVFLDGNIIDLGVYKLHVAEACSGLRYMFPIMSFTYIFAVLYKGPAWHKLALLLAAVPISVLMNSLRIGVIGVMVDRYGIEHAQGFTHLFEGWVVFGLTIAVMLGLSALMHLARGARGARGGTLAALDLDLSGLGGQLARIGDVRLSASLLGGSGLIALAGGLWLAAPLLGIAPSPSKIDRDPFGLFPRQIGEWRAVSTVPQEFLTPDIERALGADDYMVRRLMKSGSSDEVDLFVAWYEDQSAGGIHSPEICIPGGGWEIAEIGAIEVPIPLSAGGDHPIQLNRAVIQKGLSRQLVYYWFDQRGRRLASDYLAKFYLVVDGVRTGRTDGALVRLVTVIRPGESDAIAEARLRDVLSVVMPELPRFMATEWPGSAGG